jgi:glycosyltransferase involved in cell wall biosynthesis
MAGSPPPDRVAHVFGYHPAQMGHDVDEWIELQLQRWPLAALRVSALAERSTVHIFGPRSMTRSKGGLGFRIHRSALSGPRLRPFGQEWSASLGRELRALTRNSVCVIHVPGFETARLAHRAAIGSRVVLTFHGIAIGPWSDHLTAATRHVVLRDDMERALAERVGDEAKIWRMTPSVDRSDFRLGPQRENDTPVVLGYVGRLDAMKGAFDVPDLLSRALKGGFDARVEMVGPHVLSRDVQDVRDAFETRGLGDRVSFPGTLSSRDIAERMRDRWRALLLPSRSEGMPIVLLEAAASGLPIIVTRDVVDPAVREKPGVYAAPLERLGESLVRALRDPPPRDGAEWVPSHEQAAAAWDSLLTNLPRWTPVAPPAHASALSRARPPAVRNLRERVSRRLKRARR